MDKNHRFLLGIIIICNIVLLALTLNLNIKANQILKQAQRNGGRLVDVEDKVKEISGKLWLKY